MNLQLCKNKKIDMHYNKNVDLLNAETNWSKLKKIPRYPIHVSESISVQNQGITMKCALFMYKKRKQLCFFISILGEIH